MKRLTFFLGALMLVFPLVKAQESRPTQEDSKITDLNEAHQTPAPSDSTSSPKPGPTALEASWIGAKAGFKTGAIAATVGGFTHPIVQIGVVWPTAYTYRKNMIREAFAPYASSPDTIEETQHFTLASRVGTGTAWFTYGVIAILQESARQERERENIRQMAYMINKTKQQE